jgi:hypothetical protein
VDECKPLVSTAAALPTEDVGEGGREVGAEDVGERGGVRVVAAAGPSASAATAVR